VSGEVCPECHGYQVVDNGREEVPCTTCSLRAEIERLRAAGDALAVAYRTLGGLDVAYDAALVEWEARK